MGHKGNGVNEEIGKFDGRIKIRNRRLSSNNQRTPKSYQYDKGIYTHKGKNLRYVSDRNKSGNNFKKLLPPKKNDSGKNYFSYQKQAHNRQLSGPKTNKLEPRSTVPRQNKEKIPKSQNEILQEGDFDNNPTNQNNEIPVNVQDEKKKTNGHKKADKDSISNDNSSIINLPNVKSQETLYENLESPRNSKKPKRPKKEFNFKYNSDKNGLFYFLGTFPNRKQYSNPEELGNISVFCSSLVEGELSGLVGQKLYSCQTENAENSYVGVDLGGER